MAGSGYGKGSVAAREGYLSCSLPKSSFIMHAVMLTHSLTHSLNVTHTHTTTTHNGGELMMKKLPIDADGYTGGWMQSAICMQGSITIFIICYMLYIYLGCNIYFGLCMHMMDDLRRDGAYDDSGFPINVCVYIHIYTKGSRTPRICIASQIVYIYAWCMHIVMREISECMPSILLCDAN